MSSSSSLKGVSRLIILFAREEMGASIASEVYSGSYKGSTAKDFLRKTATSERDTGDVLKFFSSPNRKINIMESFITSAAF